MAVSYRFNDGLLEFTFSGSTSSHELFETFQSAYRDPLCPKEGDLLIDTRQSTSLEGRLIAKIKSFSDFILKHPERPPVRRVAVLVREEILERYTDLAHTMQQETRLSIRLFGDEERARQWLMEKGSD
jgi:hypothetical protein